MSYVERSLIFTALNHLRECCFTLEHCWNMKEYFTSSKESYRRKSI